VSTSIWLLLDALLLLLLSLALFTALSVYYPAFTKPAGGRLHDWLRVWLGAGMYFTPLCLLILPAALLPHRRQRASWRGLFWAVAATLLATLAGGLFPESTWGGVVGDACARLGYGYLGQFYPVLLVIVALLVVARLAGRALILPVARGVYRLGAQVAAAMRVASEERAAPEPPSARVAAKAGSENRRVTRRAEVLAAEIAAADAPEGESPIIRESAAEHAADMLEPSAAEPVAEHGESAAQPQATASEPAAAQRAPFAEPGIVGGGGPPDGFAAALESATRDAQAAAAGTAPAVHAAPGEPPAGQLILFPSTQVGYELPALSLLRDAPPAGGEEQHLARRAEIIERTLGSFSIEAACLGSVVGPRVTRYEVKLGPGINVSRLHALADNLALELAVKAVRIEAPIPGMSAVGIEVPNAAPQLITLKSVLASQLYKRANHPLTICLGRDIAGSPIIANLAKMPHVLVAGATGSGKSVCLNALIVSLLYRNAPDTLRLILIDPKRVEMTNYADLPHLACRVVHDVGEAQSALKWAVAEMDRRYRLLEARRARNIAAYNELVGSEEQLPFVVIVVDELADLMMLAGQVIEKLVCRIAQLSRAVGIHLVIATQRPDVRVITGTIKANIPSRIAFAVVSQIDSRVILDGGGAEKLLGSGDMLFSPIGENVPIRVQGCFLADDEIDRVVDWCRKQAAVHYDESITRFTLEEGEEGEGGSSGGGRDPLFGEAQEIVQRTGRASVSYLQRRLKIGYNRAARIMEELEEAGIVSPPDAQGNRKVL
jgi:DNA segregation ATPase FtsK/SpoIIIE-like protein